MKIEKNACFYDKQKDADMTKRRKCVGIMAYLSIVINVFFFVSCCGIVNTTGSKYFTEGGISTERVKCFVAQQPSSVKFYVEVSGSMNGFFRSNQATNFKSDVWSIITDFVSSDGEVDVFTGQNIPSKSISVNTFRDGMNRGAFVSGASTDIPDMISRMLDDVNAKSSEVGVLISDMKYDPICNSALQALLSQYSTDIRNIMMQHKDVAACLIVAKSEYLDKNGDMASADSPYYYLIVGNKSNVVFMRNFIATLLNNNKTFVDEIEWGVDYMSPSVSVSDADYLTEIEKDRSYGGFDDDCNLVLNIDITNYPWVLECRDSLISYLSIKSDNGTEAMINKNNIKYNLTYNDGKQLKRTAIAKVPVKIQNMFVDSDVFEISLNLPEIQLPNKKFMLYMGTDNVNDISKTFSIEGLISGFYSCMERYKTPKPIHILISKK